MRVAMVRMRRMALLALLVALLLPGISLAGVATEVTLNKSVLLNLQKPLERVSIAAPAIAELVVISPTQLQINGSQIGSTTLVVWEKDGNTTFYDVEVKGDTNLLEQQIREVAPNDDIAVTYVNDTIVLSGTAANAQTIDRAVQIARAYATKAESESGTNGQNAIQLLPMYGNGAAKVEKDDGTKLKVLNHVQINAPQQVLLEVKVAQVDKTALKSLGISALIKGSGGEGFSNLVGAPDGMTFTREGLRADPPGIAGDIPWLGAFSPLAPYQLGGSHYGSGIGGVLRALATKKLAKMLAEPNLLVASGKEGKFHAGQKYPVSVLSSVGGAATPTIEYVNVGVKIYFRPEVMENGLIALQIEPAEVSGISGFLPANGYPIIDTREIRTSVQLKDGESLVLGGLLQEDTIKSMSKIPLLGDIPILGALFRSTQNDLKETELVFFITPKVVRPTSPGHDPVLPTDVPLTPEQEKEFQWIPTGE
jgi:pilus assembly protein CpaC